MLLAVRITQNARRAMVLTLVIFLAGLFIVMPVQAGGVVTDCSDDSDFSNKLSGGGLVSFDCGPVTIVLADTKTIAVSTTIDGGGVVTLSGGDARRLFVVNTGATLRLRNIVIANGFSDSSDGGAIRNLDTLMIDNSRFENNHASSDWSGGAIYSAGHLAINNTSFSYNQAGSAGAIYAQAAAVNIFQGAFDHNQATHLGSFGFGGALLLTDSANAFVIASSFSQNQGRQGGAIGVRSGSSLTLNDSQVRDNMAGTGGSAGGGGIDADSASLALTRVTLSGNSGGSGGGIQTLVGTVNLNDVTLSGNSASYGSALETFLGTLTLINVTIADNMAAGAGALYNGNSVLSLLNVTLAGNSGDPSQAGGIVNTGTGPSPKLYMKNVILSAGASGPNCQFVTPPDSSEFNLSDDNSCGFGAGRDGVSLSLGPLADNGGTTQTNLPRADSPAVNQGTNSGCPEHDQRGIVRPQGAACDVGAVERRPTEIIPRLFLPFLRR